MNIHEKIQSVKVALASEGIKKGGENTYSNYKYFELADFLPRLNVFCAEFKLSHAITVSEDLQQIILTVRDIDKPDSFLEYRIPLSTANLKASHPVQNLGAVLTYSRRYLLMMAFDIVQADTLEAINGKQNTVATPQTTQTNNSNKRSFVWDAKTKTPAEELKRLWQFVNWDVSTLEQYVQERAKFTGVEVNDTLYLTIIKENISYLQSEAQAGNPAYAGMTFEEVPF
ncbi:MAG: ERF family protein [Selenomonadaceae bacterium]|nr:ERF family protein [Selenomonadaceae bacterium]